MVAKNSTFHLVIEKFDKLNNKVVSDIKLVEYLKSNEETFIYWVFILHDKDVNEFREVERPHYHLVIKCNNTLSRKTIINDIAKTLLININCISCRVVINLVKSVEYLVHKNDVDKYRYDLLDLYTNDTNETMNIILDGKCSYDIDIDNFINIVYKSKNLTQVYTLIGLSKARTYRSILVDLWKDKKVMKYELVCKWSICDDEFHYELYVDDLFICYLCSFEMIKVRLREFMKSNYYRRNML